jgi:hypothetical protein
MSRSSIRAIARLRVKAAPILEKRRREGERERGPEVIRAYLAAARDHGIRVVTLFLKGDPKIDEPLHIAWRRAHKHFKLVYSSDKPVPTEFFYERVLKDLPGLTPEEKLAGAIEQMPDWLGYFCHTDFTMRMLCLALDGVCLDRIHRIQNSARQLELNVDQLSSKWKVPIDDCGAWPFLPKGILVPFDEYREASEWELLRACDIMLKENWTPDEARQVKELLGIDGRGSVYERNLKIGRSVAKRNDDKENKREGRR